MIFAAVFAVWLAFLVVVWCLCRAAAFGDRLLDVPRVASGDLGPPGSPAHAEDRDAEGWDE